MPVCEHRSSGVRQFRQKAVLVPVVLDGEHAELASLAQLPLQGLGRQVGTMRAVWLTIKLELDNSQSSSTSRQVKFSSQV